MKGAADDGAAGERGVDAHAVLAILILHELGGGRHVLAGPDGPVLIVDVELGVTEARSMLASQKESTVPTSRQ